MLEKNYDLRRADGDGLVHVSLHSEKGLHCGAAANYLAPYGKKPTCPKCAAGFKQATWQPWWSHLLEWLLLRPLLYLFIGIAILVAADLALTQGTITFLVLTSWLH
ncbi:hypothetical protein OG784_18740 [Streptomyces sp. NBC_01617]|uniref:hypothetical protein n=1 Tax=Streptomyces sp. NBC_01617 TaxID=2975899 RepID=UPI003866DE95|nr:hypothetical protein OG784_18740 [Streptomyces sp. NBC_01617]